MRAAPSLPIRHHGGRCDDCAHVLRMKRQAQVYYNAASLKLKQASEMNRKFFKRKNITIAEDCSTRQQLANSKKQQN